jgi:hypothetical protein
MMNYEKLEKVANIYIVSYRELKKIDKKREPERYDQILQLVGTAALILRKNGVSIRL